MIIDNEQVDLNDQVYALNFGRVGVVTKLSNGFFTVTFEEGGKINYQDNGLDMQGNRVLYWHKPAMSHPKKGNQSQTTAMQALINQLEAFKDL